VRSPLHAVCRGVARIVTVCGPLGPLCGCSDAGADRPRADTVAVTPSGSQGPAGGSLTKLVSLASETRDPRARMTQPVIQRTSSRKSSPASRPPPPRPSFVIARGRLRRSLRIGPTHKLGLNSTCTCGRVRGLPACSFPRWETIECTGATSSNCGPGGENGITGNHIAFVQTLPSPIQKDEPYYVVAIAATDRTWTAKVVFVAANAWSAAQETWLDSALSRPTTYPFVVRHEPATANTTPGVTPSKAIMARHPYTLAIVGHSHTYRHPASNLA